MTQYGLFLFFAAVAGGIFLVGLSLLVLFFLWALVTAWAHQPETSVQPVERVPPSAAPFTTIIKQD